jgi:hypothetical protein
MDRRFVITVLSICLTIRQGSSPKFRTTAAHAPEGSGKRSQTAGQVVPECFENVAVSEKN